MEQLMSPPLGDGFPRRKPGRPKIDMTTRVCGHCGQKESKQWRQGPNGPATLCNPCGIKYGKKLREIGYGRSNKDTLGARRKITHRPPGRPPGRPPLGSPESMECPECRYPFLSQDAMVVHYMSCRQAELPASTNRNPTKISDLLDSDDPFDAGVALASLSQSHPPHHADIDAVSLARQIVHRQNTSLLRMTL